MSDSDSDANLDSDANTTADPDATADPGSGSGSAPAAASESGSAADRARLVGLNHVALAVGDVAAAVEFYRSLFAFDLRGRTEGMAFLDMGDQFLALGEGDDGRDADDDAHRHVGLVVDDADAVERRLAATDAERLDTAGLDFRDPWGNRIQVVEYGEIQFTKAAHVLAGMGLDLEKSESALAELAEKGLAPDDE
jgi:catechol 2,3-dioxygenase-like lactoylglutathione lyase family enzyme